MWRAYVHKLQTAVFALRRFLPSLVRRPLKPLYRRWWRASAHRRLAAAHRQHAPGVAAGCPIVCFAPAEGERRGPPAPRLLRQLAAAGHPVVYVQPDGPPGHPRRAAEANFVGVRLPGSAHAPTPAHVERWLALLAAVPAVAHAGEVVALVQSAGWLPLAQAARARWGWKLILDGLPEPAPDIDSDLVLPPAAGRSAAQFNAAVRALYPRVGIVIVSYHNLAYLQLCLDSVWTKTDYPNYAVTVVDNGSGPDVLAYLRACQAQHPHLRVIANAANLGFAHANNLGLAATADCAYVVLLNNDTVVTAGWLSGLLRPLARDPRLGLIGPVTNWTSNEARVALPYTDLAGLAAAARAYTQAHHGQVTPVTMLNFFCVALRRAVLDQVGPLDAGYGAGLFEDDDYAVRVQQAGYHLACTHGVYIHHWGWASFGRLPQAEFDQLFETNRRRFEAKWGRPWQRPPLKLM